MMNTMKRTALLLPLALGSSVWVACTQTEATPANGLDAGSTPAADAAPADAAAPLPGPTCATLGQSRCNGGLIESCVTDANGVASFGPAQRCAAATQVCKDTTCVDAPADTVSQVADMKRIADFLLDFHPWRGTVDEAKVRQDAELGLLMGDGSGERFFQVAQQAFNAVPGGHSGMYSYDNNNVVPSACAGTKADTIATSGTSWHGVCTAVSGKDIVVTLRRPTANVDLQPGERIVGVRSGATNYSGDTMLEQLGALPTCAGTQPFGESRKDVTGVSLLSLAQPGWVLRVKSLAGVERDVTLPARLDAPLSCQDGFNRRPGVDRFTVTARADGYLVVWIKSFGPTSAYPFPAQLDGTSYRAWIDGWVRDLNTEIAKYPSAKGIVWDVRGNGGGSQDLAISLAMGASAPAQGGFARCLARVPGTHPAAFQPLSTPIGDNTKLLAIPEMDGLNTVFSYAGKQVVVSSGNVYSAADYFVAAAKKRGIKVVGRAPAGAYGAAVGEPRRNLPSFIVKNTPIYAYISGWSCVDPAGNPLEGMPPALDKAVEYSSADLAAGKDSYVEEAVKLLEL